MTSSDVNAVQKFISGYRRMMDELAELPQIKRGKVFCHTCGNEESISSVNFATGWPKCCGHTMSLDSPEERRALETPEQSK